VVAGLLLGAPTATAAGAEAGTRVAPGIHLTEASSIEGEPAAPSTAEPRIVGGQTIDISQAPWQAALTLNPARYSGNSLQRLFCGGSLVTPTYIVSAAHCLLDPRTGQPWGDGEIAAVTGRTQLSSNQGQEIPVSRLFLFTDGQGRPLYNGVTSAWDISVVELAQPSSASTIKVAGSDETELWSVGRRADVTGWGATSFGGLASDLLRSAELAVLPNSACIRSLGIQFDRVTSLCAGVYRGTRDSCQGDSGGPLVVPAADGAARLVGDVQSGFECGRPLNPAAYGRLGAEPVRTPLRNAVMQLSGVDIYGSGAEPPTMLTRNQAIELAFIRADALCERQKGCEAISARKCKPKMDGFRCVVQTNGETRKQGRFRCTQSVLFTADTGTIERENLSARRCRHDR
jgi:trypsin